MRKRRATALFAPGEYVEIMQSGIIGTVVKAHISQHDTTYTVAYVDNNGNPQRRKWPESHLYPAGSDTEATEHAMDLGDYDLTNVIRYPGRQRCYAGAA